MCVLSTLCLMLSFVKKREKGKSGTLNKARLDIRLDAIN